MEDKIKVTPTNETTECPVEEIAPRAGLRVRTEVHAGEEGEELNAEKRIEMFNSHKLFVHQGLHA